MIQAFGMVPGAQLQEPCLFVSSLALEVSSTLTLPWQGLPLHSSLGTQTEQLWHSCPWTKALPACSWEDMPALGGGVDWVVILLF